jgi:hypothetical protein
MILRNVILRLQAGGPAHEFPTVVQDAQGASKAALIEQVMRQHPEDPVEAQGAQALQAWLGPIIEAAQQMASGPPGTRWHNGCVEFELPTGETRVYAVGALQSVSLGPPYEATPEVLASLRAEPHLRPGQQDHVFVRRLGVFAIPADDTPCVECGRPFREHGVEPPQDPGRPHK